MVGESPNAIDLSAEAVLELEEFRQGIRSDAPALHNLFLIMKTPAETPAFEGCGSISMLADVRSYLLFKDIAATLQPKTASYREIQEVLERHIDELERGVSIGDAEKIQQAKDFCLALNTNLISKGMADIYERRERSDSRYISDEELS